MHSVVRQTCRHVKRWRDPKVVLRWTTMGMLEASKGFRQGLQTVVSVKNSLRTVLECQGLPMKRCLYQESRIIMKTEKLIQRFSYRSVHPRSSIITYSGPFS